MAPVLRTCIVSLLTAMELIRMPDWSCQVTPYGTTVLGGISGNGGSGYGTIFALNTDGAGFTNLHTFTAACPRCRNSDGVYPYAGLLLSGNTLYGTAAHGGSSSNGTVFSL